MIELISFQQALTRAGEGKKNLLLGNGFSIACEPDVFSYSSLFEQAHSNAFSAAPELQRVFHSLATNDFEIAIRALENSAKLIPIYLPAASGIGKMLVEHSNFIKDALIRTIAQNHPETPNQISKEKFYACRKFLSHFVGLNGGRIYTLNYDLLLYWAIMHKESLNGEDPIQLEVDDGFRNDQNGDKPGYVQWNGENGARNQRIHYLHGAVHLFDAGSELKKYTWVNTGIPLLTQAQAAMDQAMFPLFVAEGESEKKLDKIKHSAYLYHSYKSFAQKMNAISEPLFIYGHSLADNDQHILDKIVNGRTEKIFVSLYGSQTSSTNEAIIAKAQSLALLRNDKYPLAVNFFDAESAQVWG